MPVDQRRWRSQATAMFCALLFLLCCAGRAAAAEDLPVAPATAVFADFAQPGGALTVFARGDYVEPYFALKALLTAQRLDVDVAAAASAFGHWLLPFQQANGPFPRICRSGAADWLACGPADADDSLDALWCLLASEVLPDDEVLAASCVRALENLATLWNPAQQTFRAMSGGSAAYFADNVEVIGALDYLRSSAAASKRFAVQLAALPSSASMRKGLSFAYGYQVGGALEPERASVPPTPYGFYPNAVAPVYLWLYGLRRGASGARYWRLWMARYGTQWLAGASDHYPWGLIAWAAYRSGDPASAQRWLDNAAGWRAAGRWNIVEEGVSIGLRKVLATPDMQPSS